jgi:hypothetical protein
VNSATTMAAVSATASIPTVTAAGAYTLNVDVYRPRERYVQLVRTATSVAQVNFGSVICTLYGPLKLPTTAASGVTQTTVASPTE